MKAASRVLLLVALAAVLAALPGRTHAATYTGDGSVRPNRLPWVAGSVRLLNQGWFGSFSHSSQYATDWNGEFWILGASEGDATCTFDGGWGYRVRVGRVEAGAGPVVEK